MAQRRNHSIVAVITNLTENQAALIAGGIIREKSKHAPNARGTVVTGNKGQVGGYLQSANRKYLEVQEGQADEEKRR